MNRLGKKIVWIILGLILLELLLRTAGATYLLQKKQQNKLSEDTTKDTYIILCLGESTTEAGGVYSWPSQLEAILNERNPDKEFTVINGGAGGTTTAFILSKLEMDIDKYTPDIVITMMGANDERLGIEYKTVLKSGIITQIEDFRIYKLGALIWAAVTKPSETNSQKENRLKNLGGELKKEIQINPNNSDTYAGFGWLYYKEKDTSLGDTSPLEEAEGLFKNALEINPSNGDAYTGLGWVYVDLGINLKEASMFEEAEKMFRKAIELGVPYEQKPWFSVYEGLAWSYEFRGMYREAIETSERILELSKSGAIDNSLDGQAYIQLGRLYRLTHQEESPKLKTAEEMFKKALEINPNNGDAYVGLGWVYLDLGILLKEPPMLEEAEEMLKKAIELDVPDGQIDRIYQGLGTTYEHREMYPEAIETYEELVELSGSGAINNRLEGWAYAKLGQLYHETGVPDEDIEEFYKKAGVSFKVPGNATAYEITKNHYIQLYDVLKRRGISLVVMQYPTRRVDDLKQMFSEDDDVTFVSNEENFRQALDEGRYEDYFIDRCYGDFGHATPKGNRLIAENVADAIIGDVSS